MPEYRTPDMGYAIVRALPGPHLGGSAGSIRSSVPRLPLDRATHRERSRYVAVHVGRGATKYRIALAVRRYHLSLSAFASTRHTKQFFDLQGVTQLRSTELADYV